MRNWSFSCCVFLFFHTPSCNIGWHSNKNSSPPTASLYVQYSILKQRTSTKRCSSFCPCITRNNTCNLPPLLHEAGHSSKIHFPMKFFMIKSNRCQMTCIWKESTPKLSKTKMQIFLLELPLFFSHCSHSGWVAVGVLHAGHAVNTMVWFHLQQQGLLRKAPLQLAGRKVTAWPAQDITLRNNVSFPWGLVAAFKRAILASFLPDVKSLLGVSRLWDPKPDQENVILFAVKFTGVQIQCNVN